MSAAPILRRAIAGDHAALSALQEAAYAANRAALGVEPLPLLADYTDVIANKECWLSQSDGRLNGALILEFLTGSLLIWSISVAPDQQNAHLGRQLMAFAEQRAREVGKTRVTLYTGQKLTHLIGWYSRLGYEITQSETLTDRVVVHMEKHLSA